MTLKNEIDRVDISKSNINTVRNNTNVVLEKYGEIGAENLNEITEKLKSVESKMTKYARITLNKKIKADYNNKSPHVEIPLQINFNPKTFCILFETMCSKIAQAYGSKAIVSIGGNTTEVIPTFTMQATAGTSIDITLKNIKIENKTLKFDFEGYIPGEYYTREITLKTVTIAN